MQEIRNKECKLFGKHIKELRKMRNWSIAEVAQRSDIHRNYISDVERGTRNISLVNIVKIAKAFDLKLNELFDFDEE